MARTSITVTTVAGYNDGTVISTVNGDAANDHSVDASTAPKLMLYVYNTAGNSIDFTIELAAGPSSFNQAVSISQTIEANRAAAILLDVPADLLQSGGLVHIDSADANFSDLRFAAYTWQSTPRQ